MLLDRKRVKFWQKWVFGFMAIVMAGFLVMIPISRVSGCGGSGSASNTKQLDAEIVKNLATAKTDPTSADAWRTLAESYVLRAGQQKTGSAGAQGDLQTAAKDYERAAKLLAKQKGPAARQKQLDTLQQVVSVYVSLSDFQQATNAYGRITDLTPNDAQAFYELASVAISAGDTTTALLAFNKFLELDPKSPDAAAVKDWISKNAPKATPSPTSTKGS